MLRAFALLVCAAMLTGCESLGDLTSDAFDPGGASQSQFTLDTARCRAVGDNHRNYDIVGIAGTHAERHELFNAAFESCMRKAGYARRDWSPDIAIPYNVDPTPG